MATDALSHDPLQVLPVELRPNVDHLVTEDDTPVDNVFSEKQQRLLTEPLYASYRLEAMEFRKLDEPVWFPEVGLGLRVWEGRYEDMGANWLRWFDASGTLVPTGRERAETAEARAERLAAQLRQLGAEPGQA